MQIDSPGRAVRVGWFPRAIVSGLSASLTTFFAFIVAYGLAMVLVGLLAERGLGGTLLGQWLYALTHNHVLDVGLASVYVAATCTSPGGWCGRCSTPGWPSPTCRAPTGGAGCSSRAFRRSYPSSWRCRCWAAGCSDWRSVPARC